MSAEEAERQPSERRDLLNIVPTPALGLYERMLEKLPFEVQVFAGLILPECPQPFPPPEACAALAWYDEQLKQDKVPFAAPAIPHDAATAAGALTTTTILPASPRSMTARTLAGVTDLAAAGIKAMAQAAALATLGGLSLGAYTLCVPPFLLGVSAIEAATSTYRSTTAIVRAKAHRAAFAAKTAAMELAINAAASAITHGITALTCATSAALAAVDAVQAAMRSLEVWRKGDDAFTGSSLVYHKLMQNAKPNPCAHTL